MANLAPARHDCRAQTKELYMSQLLRGGIAAFGAWKLGGGIIGTILVFLLVYWLLGYVF